MIQVRLTVNVYKAALCEPFTCKCFEEADVAKCIIYNVLVPLSGTIFGYGQTGTGKTFTMEGVRTVPELRGIIPNSFAHIFGAIAKAEGETR